MMHFPTLSQMLDSSWDLLDTFKDVVFFFFLLCFFYDSDLSYFIFPWKTFPRKWQYLNLDNLESGQFYWLSEASDKKCPRKWSNVHLILLFINNSCLSPLKYFLDMPGGIIKVLQLDSLFKSYLLRIFEEGEKNTHVRYQMDASVVFLVMSNRSRNNELKLN